MTYKTGTIGEFAQWTKRVVADPTVAHDTPKRWFDSEETAEKALGTLISPEAMVKLLSANISLLRLIAVNKPASIIELAQQAHRAAPNLLRTLNKLKEAGIIVLEHGPGRTRIPRVAARRVTLELDLMGPDSIVSVERPEDRAIISAID